MRTVVKTINIYKFETAPEKIKEKIRDYFYTDFDLYDFYMDERIKSLKGFSEYFDLSLDYSLSCVADRGEFIRFEGDLDDIGKEDLKELNDCHFTGVCYDEDILDVLKKSLPSNDVLEALNINIQSYINSIHSEYQAMLKDEYLSDLCESNGYEFTENGKLY